MTYTPTHLAVQGIIVWLLLSKKNKAYYKEHRWEFILINLVAVLPDIDLLIGYHRSYTHSLILPTFILFSMLVIDKINKDASPIESATHKIVRFVKLASLMWIIHIFLDLSWGPLMLFWPLDNNLYDLSVYLRFRNEAWLFFPLTFVGLIPDWSIYSMTEGQRMFFIDLSQEELQSIYGEFLDLYIAQFTFHVLLFIVWMLVILFPAFRRKKKKPVEDRKKLYANLKATWSLIKRQLTLFGIFLIFLGLMLGPIIGLNRSIDYEISYEYKSTQSLFDPTLGIAFANKPQATTLVNFSSETGLVDYNVTVLTSTNDTFISFFDNFENLTNNYYDKNITYEQMIASYSIITNQAKGESIFESRLIGDEIASGILIAMNETEEEETVFLITFVDEWNTTESFIYEARIVINYVIHRKQAVIEGGILSGIGLAIIIVDQIIALRKSKKTKS
ncbi:MAG: metal-dependent hydrolase [Candidatus Heimdallarchaeota archaeon]|nr:metal-dependent hydrolase [Candidatus Heimdallarchaeota archaeon]MCG3254761.1 metal-dependent hydrolase [Candidatus Heimdallarchaeota archaeon]MCK4609840.1 metal-dependent hydrolase [Candidatus Heimdallarchaeota archaeon]